MMFNPMQIMQMINNPQAMVQQAMNNPHIMNNPVVKNAIGMAQRGDNKGLEELVRNAGREKGVDVDQIINQFRNFRG